MKKVADLKIREMFSIRSESCAHSDRVRQSCVNKLSDRKWCRVPLTSARFRRVAVNWNYNSSHRTNVGVVVAIKVRFAYIVPHMPPQQRCTSQTGPAFGVGRSPCPHSRTLACSHAAVRSHSLPF